MDDNYQYSQPLSVNFTKPGAFSTRIETPFGHECEIAVEWINLTTNDASVFITWDNDPSNIPGNGPINGYLLSGVGTKNPLPIFNPITQYVWIIGVVGVSNSAVNVVLRFRRPNTITIPSGFKGFTSGE